MSCTWRLLNTGATASRGVTIVRGFLFPFERHTLSILCVVDNGRSYSRRSSTESPAATRVKKQSKTTSKRGGEMPSPSPPVQLKADEFSEEEHRLAENDTRLAMRMLMSSHFSVAHHSHAPEREQRQKEREAILEKHQDRERRLRVKDTNSMHLLGADGMAMGDGILPLLLSPRRQPHSKKHSRGCGGASATTDKAWRALNPVGLAASQGFAASSPSDAADDESTVTEAEYSSFLADSAAELRADRDEGGDAEAWKSATLATMSVPDLSVYDTDHDFRISSEDVVRKTFETGVESAGGSTGGPKASPGAPLDEAVTDPLLAGSAKASRSAAAEMQLQLDEDEDLDYTVSLFTDGPDDPLDL